ncbi:MAG: rhomboid family intramembrane serine protease [Leptospira sp.]|nr:rhomboid family intramembrane serine protease [Leptospira sp.]
MSRNSSQSPSLFGNPLSHPLNIILILNCFIFFLQYFANQQLLYRFGLIPEFVISGRVWQVFTYGFLHVPDLIPFHLLVNMYGMYMLGTHLIPILGKTKFTIFYFLSQLGAGLFVVGSAYLNEMLGGNIQFLESTMRVTIGASGALFGLLALFGIFYPETELLLLIFPVKAKNAVWVSLAIGYVISQLSGGNVSNTCHLGGAVSGLLLYKLFQRKIDPSKVPFPFHLEEIVEKKLRSIPKQTSVEDLFLDQKKINEDLLQELGKRKTSAEVVAYLKDKQVADANICPPSTYNTEDPICLRCEWIANCALRKALD